METTIFNDTVTAVNLFLKDGRRLCGLLLNNLNNVQENNQWQFVSNWNLKEYEKTHSPRLVEVYPTEAIDHIDPYLK